MYRAWGDAVLVSQLYFGVGVLSLLTGLGKAMQGQALDAAAYAAYASVYAYGGYAVNDPGSFAGEHAWQLAKFKVLAGTPVGA